LRNGSHGGADTRVTDVHASGGRDTRGLLSKEDESRLRALHSSVRPGFDARVKGSQPNYPLLHTLGMEPDDVVVHSELHDHHRDRDGYAGHRDGASALAARAGGASRARESESSAGRGAAALHERRGGGGGTGSRGDGSGGTAVQWAWSIRRRIAMEQRLRKMVAPVRLPAGNRGVSGGKRHGDGDAARSAADLARLLAPVTLASRAAGGSASSLSAARLASVSASGAGQTARRVAGGAPDADGDVVGGVVLRPVRDLLQSGQF
jgi:hypothetical protein